MAQRSPRRWRRSPCRAANTSADNDRTHHRRQGHRGGPARQGRGARCGGCPTQHGITPGLAVVLVGNNPASESYVGSKAKVTVETGMRSFDHRLPETVSQDELLALVRKLNADPAVHGILVQLPLPPQIDAQSVLDAIDPAQGCRRLSSGERRTARDRPAGADAVHAARLHPAGEDGARLARRPGGGGGRPLQHRRQAGGAAAARRERHRDGDAFQDPRSAGGLPPRRSADRRDRARRRWCAATGSSRARR